MEQFELQKSISQLFSALKRYLCVNLFKVGHSEELYKIHYFRKNSFVTSSLYYSMFTTAVEPLYPELSRELRNSLRYNRVVIKSRIALMITENVLSVGVGKERNKQNPKWAK